MAANNVLQYVGARYVPVFYQNPNGTWDWLSGVQYEPLTIVKYGTSTYTSKQLVPATVGSPNTAPDYWALTGDYNGAIVALQESIASINDDILEIERYGSTYNQKNRKYLLIGDSWSAPTDSWINLILNSGNNFDITNVAVGGDGFSNGGFLRQLSGAPNKNYTDILVQGYANDQLVSVSTLIPYINTFMDTCKTKYPKASITFLFMSHRPFSFYNKTDLSSYLLSNGVGVVKCDRIIGNTMDYNIQTPISNTLHLNSIGQQKLSRAMLNFFCGKSPYVTVEFNTSTYFNTIVSQDMLRIIPSTALSNVLVNTNTDYDIEGLIPGLNPSVNSTLKTPCFFNNEMGMLLLKYSNGYKVQIRGTGGSITSITQINDIVLDREWNGI